MIDGDPALPLAGPPRVEPVEQDRYDRLRRDLAHAVSRLCPSWLAAARDDIVQVAVLKVMGLERRSEGNYSSEGKSPLAASYLYRVAYSAVVDEIRARRRRPEVELGEDEMANTHTSAEPAPDAAARAREIGRGIRACLAAMKEERRLGVTLHLLGHSVPETARLLGWAAKRTENLVYRGIADLRDCLAGKGLAP
jgi:RNA polymerase sigma-70 factor (ECF subfamily)